MLVRNERGVSIVEATIVFSSLVLVAFFGWQVYSPSGRAVQSSTRFAGSASGVVQTAATNNIFLTRNEDGTVSINNNGATAAELVRIARTIANDAGVGVCTGILRFGSLVVGRCSNGTTPGAIPARVANTAQASGQEEATLVAWQNNITSPGYVVAKIANADSAGRSSGFGGGGSGPTVVTLPPRGNTTQPIGYVGPGAGNNQVRAPNNNQVNPGGGNPVSPGNGQNNQLTPRTNPQQNQNQAMSNTTSAEQATNPISEPGIQQQPNPPTNSNQGNNTIPQIQPPTSGNPINPNNSLEQPDIGVTTQTNPDSGVEPSILLGEGSGGRSLAITLPGER